MKKIISILLCVALMCSLTLTSFAAEKDVVEIAEEVYGIKATEYLKALEVIESDAEYNLTEKITRGEFAKMACVVSGYPAADPAVVKFTDVSADNAYAPYINSLANAGIINGYSDGTYGPDRELYMGEAVVMLTTILGYGPYAQAKGGYPAGYYYTASRLDLFDYLDNNGDMTVTITKGEAAQLLANALDTLTLEPTSFGDEPKFSTTEGMTLAYRTFNIVHITGIVESVDISALKGENLTPPWYMVIDGVKIEVGKIHSWDYLGYEVDAYYVEGSNTKKSELKYITKTDYNEETVIAISDIQDISSGKVTFWNEDGKKDDVRYKTVASVIFNGAATGESFDMDLISGYEGEITLVDNDGNSVADVIFVDAYTDYVVDIVDGTREKIYDRYTKGLSVTGDVTADDPYTIIYDVNGEEVGLSGVKVDNIISVYKSKNDADQLLYKLYVSDKTAVGKLEAITQENGRTILTVLGTDYKIAKSAVSRLEGKFKVGDTVTLYLNIFGEISDMKVGSALSFGFLLGIDTEGGFSSNALFKLYADNGQFMLAYAAPKLKVDNKTYSAGNTDEYIAKLQASSKVIYPDADAEITAQPVRFRINGNGELAYIDTVFSDIASETVATKADANGDNALFAGPKGTQLRHRSSGGSEIFIDQSAYGSALLVANSATKVMKYIQPTAGNEDFLDEKNYSVIGVNSVPAGTEKENLNDVRSFFCSADDEAVPFILLNSDKVGTISTSTSLGVIASVSQVLYEEQPCYKLTVQGKSGRSSIYVNPEFTYTPAKVTDGDAAELNNMTASSFKEGDVVKVSTDIDGYLSNIKLYYRITENRRVESFESNTYDYQTASGFVYEKAANAFRLLSTTDRSELTGADVATTMLYPASTSCTYVVYDSQAPQGKRVKGGGYSDILPFGTVGAEETSYVLMQSYVCVPTFMVVVK